MSAQRTTADADRGARPTRPTATSSKRQRTATNQRIAEITRRQHGVIARRQLVACGLSPGGIASRVRRALLFPVVRGVFSVSPHVDAWGHRHAAVLAVRAGPGSPSVVRTSGRRPSGAADRVDDAPSDGGGPTATPRVLLSHWSAAQAHGLITATQHRHHVTVEGSGARRVSAVRLHRARALLPDDVTEVEGVLMTSPARTILDCAVGATPTQVRRLIREAEFQRLLEAGAMVAAVRRCPHHPGSGTVRKADPQTAESALQQTPLEDRVAALIAGLPLPPPAPQHALVGASGQHYRADFAWPELKLIVEADGRPAHDRSTSFDSDRQRDADLAAAGWMTLRFTSATLHDPAQVSETILATARTRDGDATSRRSSH